MLKILKGGKLTLTKYSKKTTVTTVTAMAPRFLFSECEIENGVTLRDIFKILNKNIDIFNMIYPWCKNIVSEGIKTKKSGALYDRDAIEFLELYFMGERDLDHMDEQVVYGLNNPSFHGIGFKLAEDYEEMGYKRGERIAYSLMASSPCSIIDTPIILNRNLSIYDGLVKQHKEGSFGKNDPIFTASGMKYTFGQIIYAIVYELSWFGSQKNRNKEVEKVNKIARKMKRENKKRVRKQ